MDNDADIVVATSSGASLKKIESKMALHLAVLSANNLNHEEAKSILDTHKAWIEEYVEKGSKDMVK